MATNSKKEAKSKSKAKPAKKAASKSASSTATKPKLDIKVVNSRDKLPDEEMKITKRTRDDVKAEMKTGKVDEDIYTKEGQESLEEDDEIKTWEEGFMEGATDDGQLGKDALTGASLIDADNIYEVEFEGKNYRFVSEKNAIEFLNKKERLAKKSKEVIRLD
jgi:YHS domain-containing protein